MGRRAGRGRLPRRRELAATHAHARSALPARGPRRSSWHSFGSHQQDRRAHAWHAGHAWQPPVQHEREPPLASLVREGWLRLHWSLWVGLGMLIMLLGWIALNTPGAWWQTTQDDWRYGRPRTFQVDAVVGHNSDSPTHPSHFLALNLNRHVLVIELPAGDPYKARIYSGPGLIMTLPWRRARKE